MLKVLTAVILFVLAIFGMSNTHFVSGQDGQKQWVMSRSVSTTYSNQQSNHPVSFIDTVYLPSTLVVVSDTGTTTNI